MNLFRSKAINIFKIEIIINEGMQLKNIFFKFYEKSLQDIKLISFVGSSLRRLELIVTDS